MDTDVVDVRFTAGANGLKATAPEIYIVYHYMHVGV